jgi:hypothetical protein
MYAGHFALVPVIQKYYPQVSPFILTFGVAFLDLVFGVLSSVGIEGFSQNTDAGTLGVNLHCSYSHSLIGSILLSVIYSVVTGSYMPGFLASFSHFVEDWLVHNLDLPLDPFSGIIVGGTQLWGNYPTFAFYFELVFCIALAFLGPHDIINIYTTFFVVLLHFSNREISPFVFKKVLSMPSKFDRQIYSALTMILCFSIPAVLISILMMRRTKMKKN